MGPCVPLIGNVGVLWRSHNNVVAFMTINNSTNGKKDLNLYYFLTSETNGKKDLRFLVEDETKLTGFS